ncbi:VCBS repeat-containing protein [Zobellia roscoffensis]|uniref:VCBS repeat-containing protein n=1 Tax=Zobellia roscoffensis TaxID=2779508 RepID=UPI00188A80D8|nr:VCBS repeat-containing protein [Zobellia roscoffensis]
MKINTISKILYSCSIVILLLFTSCKEQLPSTRFVIVNQKVSNLVFNNQLIENDSINIMDNEFVYNGAGVALGDINGDGFDDIFFAGNQVENKLFLNLKGLNFKDITETSLIKKRDSLQWSSGVSIIDINADGLMDIYVCNTFRKKENRRENLLYINQGNNSQGIPSFKEMAKEYGIADNTYSSHAQFFDFDNDGDLDLFIGVNRIEGIDPSDFRPIEDDGSSMSKDRLYENVFDTILNKQKFVDISEKAGIKFHGYSHSTLINDFNSDGWPDIYVANDFLSSDLIYINNQNGTFTNEARKIFKHFSLSSMGSDAADINNNGNLELFTTEMLPYYNKRKKLFQGPSNYQKEIFIKKYDYEKQYARNTLQTQLGTNPETELPVYAEIAMLTDTKETDWSWAPLFADYNNDGLQDLFITNGFPKDVTDRDFGDFRASSSRLLSKEKLLAAIPEIKIPNFMFNNQGNLKFKDSTKDWGLNLPTYSTGAAYGDLDQDGDLDLVVNNINDNALLLENKSNEHEKHQHYLRIKLNGKENNPNAIGSYIEIFSDTLHQKKSLLSGRGYLSQPELTFHFGLGKKKSIDSLLITWPNRECQMVKTTAIDSLLEITYSAQAIQTYSPKKPESNTIFQNVTHKYNLEHLSLDHDFIDFNFQSTLPHKFSQYGPSLSVGDINNDGLEDMFVAASRNFKEKWFIQNPDQTFNQIEVAYKKSDELEEEDAGTLLFDADKDGDLDLFIARGCAQYPIGHNYYQDILMINDGNGHFSKLENGLPEMKTNSSTVKAADFDHDGDLDLFIGSRVLPFSYPMSDRSYILRNDSTKDKIKFTDVTKTINPNLEYPGLISDALWTDFNGDSWPDLILASEWAPLRFFRNENGKLFEITASTGIQKHFGWWNSLAASDLDNDGDIDYIAGNVGNNINFKGSKKEPVRIYAKDLDQNGSIDPLISFYLRDSIGTRKEYLYHPWQDVTKQYVGIRKIFNSYGAFGESTLPEMFTDGLLDDAQVDSLTYMKSSWIENLGNNQFKIHPLPIQAQFAPVYGILPLDFNTDNLTDILLVGNDYGMEVQQGPADAFIGILLKNNGNGRFVPVSLDNSGFFIPGDAKALVKLRGGAEKTLITASQNNDSLKVFSKSKISNTKTFTLKPNEVKVYLDLSNGKKQMHEFYWGSTFQSQSGRFIDINSDYKKIRFYNNNGNLTRQFQP